MSDYYSEENSAMYIQATRPVKIGPFTPEEEAEREKKWARVKRGMDRAGRLSIEEKKKILGIA